MVTLYTRKNLVFLKKSDPGYIEFVLTYLVKYEEVLKPDYFNRKSKKFRSVKERRNLFTDYPEYISFSRGILELIPKEVFNIVEINDNNKIIKVPELSTEEIKKTLDIFDLREDQIIAVNKCLHCKRGVIQLPTAVGKSAIITATIKRLSEKNPNMKFLVIAPTLSTVNNITNSLEKNNIPVSIYGHPSKIIENVVTTGLPQSLVAADNPNLLQDIDAVFYDECLPKNSVILLSDGSTATIEEIYENDSITEVLSYNIKTDTYIPCKILRKFKTEFNNKFCKVYYQDPKTNELLGVTCTSNHKIYIKDKGYIPASEVIPGDLIKVDYTFARNWQSLIKFTYIPVTKVVLNVGKVAKYKYNLEIEDTHCYFANNVLVSNCHHLKCDTWNKLNEMLYNVEYSLGFSALSINKNEIYINNFKDLSYDSSLIIGSAGKVLMHMDPSYYIEKGIIALPIIFRIKHTEQLPRDIDPTDWHKVAKYGLMSTARTEKIARVSSIFAKNNRKVLILVSEKDYAFRICEFLLKYNITKFGISFGAGNGYLYDNSYDLNGEIKLNYKEEESLKVIDKLSSGEINILIATSHVDEGVDISNLDVCILACGGKKDRRIIQRVGRVLRKTKTGKYAYVIDFTDDGCPVLSRQSKSRLTMYKQDIGVPLNNIYDKIDIEMVEPKFLELES